MYTKTSSIHTFWSILLYFVFFIFRPYIIVEQGKPLVKAKHIRRLLRNEMTFDDFLLKGLVEYLVMIEKEHAKLFIFSQT